MLDSVNVAEVGDPAAAMIWERVVRKLRSGTMPPVGLPRPDKASADAVVAYLEAALDREAKVRPNPGRTGVHRLNRTEYANAVRDLLAVEIDPRSLLPPDSSGLGFDNIAAVLSVTPGLLERYMSAARKISRLAVGDPTLRPATQTYSISPLLLQNDRISEDVPFGSRGGAAIRHHFPLDGEYVVKIRLQRTYAGGTIRGIGEPTRVDVRLDGTLVRSFEIGNASKEEPKPEERQAADAAGRESQRNADAALQVRLAAKAGAHVVAITFPQKTFETEGVRPTRYPIGSFAHVEDRDALISVDNVQISGPFEARGSGETPSRRRIFVCNPVDRRDEAECAKKIIVALARRAYRRSLAAGEIARLEEFYEAGRANKSFEAGIQVAVERLLVDPNFLFRIERDPESVRPNTAYRVSDTELASRLSFFLWSSIPDDELLTIAEAGKLSNDATLERQVRRMLADPKSKALVENFAGQWLYLRNLRGVTPDPDTFPDFDDSLREAFRRETELFIESMVREDRPIGELLTANHSFVNERLATHYGIPGVYGSHFRRVAFADDKRAGLLGQGSVLTVTSYATRTSPVLRGKWLLENILGTPPPPPPPTVPDLKERNDQGQVLSLRQRMEQHRQNPTCASCHAQMDPLGFALENFDAVGRWRDLGEDGKRVDASGALPDGTQFQGPADFRAVLLGRRDELVATVTEKLLTYALGRALEYFDAPAIRRIVAEVEPTDYRWSAVILGVVKSVPFQMRTSVHADSARPERSQAHDDH